MDQKFVNKLGVMELDKVAGGRGRTELNEKCKKIVNGFGDKFRNKFDKKINNIKNGIMRFFTPKGRPPGKLRNDIVA